VRECAGLLWAYMGPLPAPELPVWEPFNWQNGFREIVLADVPCNWFQAQENSIDPVHFEWMHDNWSNRMKGSDANAPKHLKLKFEEFEHGFTYKRVREGQSEEDKYWTIGRVALWPNGFYLGRHFEWRVPVDDENTLSVAWFFVRVPKGREPYVQNSVPTWKSPIKDGSGRMARELNTAGITLKEFQDDPLLRQRLKEFRHHYGQPPEVRAAFAEAMGIAGS